MASHPGSALFCSFWPHVHIFEDFFVVLVSLKISLRLDFSPYPHSVLYGLGREEEAITCEQQGVAAKTDQEFRLRLTVEEALPFKREGDSSRG